MTEAVYTMEEVAGRLHKSRRWLQDFLRGQPIGRLAGRTRLFTETDITRLIEALPLAPEPKQKNKTKRKAKGYAPKQSSLDEALNLASERPSRKHAKANVVAFPHGR